MTPAAGPLFLLALLALLFLMLLLAAVIERIARQSTGHDCGYWCTCRGTRAPRRR